MPHSPTHSSGSAPSGVVSAPVEGSADERLFYVRVELTCSDGQVRRGTVEVRESVLRLLSQDTGSARQARRWIREVVADLCKRHPQDFSLGAARWRQITGKSLSDLVEEAARDRATIGQVSEELAISERGV